MEAATIEKDKAIRGLVEAAVRSYATGFEARHLAEVNDPDGVINMKVHNPFIVALGAEVRLCVLKTRFGNSSDEGHRGRAQIRCRPPAGWRDESERPY